MTAADTQIVRDQGDKLRIGDAALVVMDPSEPGEQPSLGLCKMTSRGIVRAIRTTITLSPAAGHVYSFPGQGNMIAAAGYDHINKAIGVSRFQPPDMVGDDGARHPNPWVVYDQFDSIKRVVVRMIGFGRNAIGNWLALDSTLHYDLIPCFAQDVLRKWKPKNGTQAKWGTMYPAENVPSDVRTAVDKKCIALPGGYVLAVELTGDMLQIIAEHAHRCRFATRNAETIVWRNILKRFVGRQKLGDSFGVTVTAWQQPDREHVDQLVNLVESASGGSFQIDGDIVNVETDSVTVADPESEAEALTGEEHEDAAREPFEPQRIGQNVSSVVQDATQAPPPPPVVSPGVRAARKAIVALVDELGEADALKALNGAGFADVREVMGALDERWLDQGVEALQQVKMERIAAKQRKQHTAGKEREAANAASDGGSPAMGPAPDSTNAASPTGDALFDGAD